MRNSLNKDVPYYLHRIALLPLLPDASPGDIGRACQHLDSTNETAFLNFLRQQGLAAMWDKMLEDNDSAQLVSNEFKASLHQTRLLTTGTYLLHHHHIQLIKTTLEQANISHVVYKGADIRERLYNEPALRPSADIDVLVHEQHKIAVIKAFKQQSFELCPSATIISHEVSLLKGGASIDLHWDILRPGRTRIPMANTLLESRIDYGSHWGMSNEATLFIMLVHPVFAKYGTAPNASLMRMVDMALLLAQNNINWQAVRLLLDKAGLKTAAWITLKWYQLLTDHPPPAEFTSAIKPGKLRQKYLNHWLEKNLSSALFEKPVYVQLGFTLPAHDSWKDAFRAVRRARELRYTQEADLNTLLECTKI